MIPERIPNCVGGEDRDPLAEEWLPKLDPASGRALWQLARSRARDVALAVTAAAGAQIAWAATPAVRRGEVLWSVASAMHERRALLGETVARETGKSPREALGEADGSIALARFFAGEGQRLYGRTTGSAAPGRQIASIREPMGIAGLIAAANTPLANVAWKVFPALVCGNAAVLKAPEDAPATAWLVHRIARDAGLPAGTLNVLQGLGPEAGAPLVADERVAVISFTGSTAVGRDIAVAAGQRLAKVSLELGGKNPFVVCDDADLDRAVRWALLSAFSNAGQRCSSGTRLIVYDAVYAEFRDRFLGAMRGLRVGTTDDDDLGPVINERALTRILEALDRARSQGARVLAGGSRLVDDAHREGYFVAPTLVEPAGTNDELSTTELFGPVACLYRVRDLREAVAVANANPYGLTACVHTRDFDRAHLFAREVQAGTVSINAGTYGSEPHLPFGGVKQSGNGSREPGTEALDVYSSLKTIALNVDQTMSEAPRRS